MTGWRLGYAAGPAEILNQMTKLQQYTFVCAPSPFQVAAVKAMDVDMQGPRDAYRKKRNLVYELLSKKFDVVNPAARSTSSRKRPKESAHRLLHACD